MPILTRDVGGLLVRLDYENLGMIRYPGRRRRMHVEPAEAAAERLVLLDRQLLLAKEEHQMIHERIVHILELPVSELLGQVDAKDLGADAWRHLAYFYALIDHAFLA